MTDWSRLNHAYGQADDMPAILEALSPNPDAPAWGELWSRVCHQGTVYSASAPVLTHLLALARTYEGADRVTPLQLAGEIVNSRDRSAGFQLDAHRSEIDALASIARATLALRDLAWLDFVYLLQATLALEDDEAWADALFGLSDGEIQGECPHCDTHLQIVVGQEGFFVTDEEWLDNPEAPRNAIAPAEAASLQGIGARLHRLARDADQPKVADRLRYVFGQADCPACEKRFAIEEAIERAV